MKKKFILLPITLTTLAPAIGLIGCNNPHTPDPKPISECLTFKATAPSTICTYTNHQGDGTKIPNLSYSINNSEWQEYIVSDIEEGFGDEIELKTNDIIRFKGNNPNGFNSYDDKTHQNVEVSFSMSGSLEASGNIMSLIDDGKCEQMEIPNNYCFQSLFNNAQDLKSIKNLFLPATTLKDFCYDEMFTYCSSITEMPDLPATELADGCYKEMFLGCSLSTTKELLAQTLTNACYLGMFAWNTSLKSVGKIHAKQFEEESCDEMFASCSNLKIHQDSSTNIFVSFPSDLESDDVNFMFWKTGGDFTDDPLGGHSYSWY